MPTDLAPAPAPPRPRPHLPLCGGRRIPVPLCRQLAAQALESLKSSCRPQGGGQGRGRDSHRGAGRGGPRAVARRTRTFLPEAAVLKGSAPAHLALRACLELLGRGQGVTSSSPGFWVSQHGGSLRLGHKKSQWEEPKGPGLRLLSRKRVPGDVGSAGSGPKLGRGTEMGATTADSRGQREP